MGTPIKCKHCGHVFVVVGPNASYVCPSCGTNNLPRIGLSSILKRFFGKNKAIIH